MLTLAAEPRHFAILPLYIVLLLALPAMLVLLRHAPVLALCGSAVLYVSAQSFPDSVVLPPPWRAAWYFNPFAWQLLFFGGAVLAVYRAGDRSRVPRGVVAVVVSVILLEAAFIATVLLPERSIPWTGKAELGPLRIADLACLIVLARYLLPSSEVFRRSLFARPVVLCGQNSLVTYCIGGLLAIVGGLALSATSGGLGWQALVNAVGWIGCVGAASLWFRCKGRRRFNVYHVNSQAVQSPETA